MMSESALRKEVREYYDSRADVPVEMNRAVYEIVNRRAPASGPDAEWWTSYAYVGVWHVCAAVNRSIKKDEEAIDARQGELYPGYKRLQRRYSVERNDNQWLIPVGELTDEEIDAKIAEHRSMAAGHELHALELERFKASRVH